ncbi:hypothetical protein OS493_011463 [Desmophyllum pertusum]|uniref:Uncharacterized protein n=1 Tax=Desmophyllum pertusum TaxID=174260 RepID=A0A9W9YTC9_9CNID|nr:hypothetical protein OS493_011463 [Desmophyllum pertusum]
MPRRATGKPRGRPSLPGTAKVIRLRESVYQTWRKRKTSMGFSNATDSAFAEILLHLLPDRDENRRDVLRSRMTVATPMSPVMSTPIRGGNAPKFVSPSNAIQLWSEQSREISNRPAIRC